MEWGTPSVRESLWTSTQLKNSAQKLSKKYFYPIDRYTTPYQWIKVKFL
jgi:hypothetical protein